MRRNTGGLELFADVVRHPVINDALSDDRTLLLAVKRGGVILIINDEHIGIIGKKDLFRLFGTLFCKGKGDIA